MDEWSYEDGLRLQAERREKWFQNVLVNPSASEVARLCRASTREDGIRGIIVGDDLYWWDPWLATHGDAIRWMKINLHREKPRLGCVEAHLCDDGKIGLCGDDDETLAALEAHRTLVGMIDDEGSLIE